MMWKKLAEKEEIRWLAYPRYTHQEIKGFLNTLLERIDELFRFTQDHRMEGDNNLAERGLRKAVIIRKISNGSRSDSGAEILEVFFLSWKRQDYRSRIRFCLCIKSLLQKG